MSFNNRSNALIELLKQLDESEVRYVLVGGYAVSAFNTRFSTDLDIVVAPENREVVERFLEERGFEETDSHTKDWVYDMEVIEYEKRLAPREPIGFDLLVNGVGCRQTETQWSFDYLYEHITEQDVSSGMTATTARVDNGAVLVAAKLHSGRENDLRDVLAVTEEIDLDAVTPHLRRGNKEALSLRRGNKEALSLRRGNKEALSAQLKRGLDILESEELKHGFRSDFGSSAVSEETIISLQTYLSDQIDQLS
jgi:hypothetical protein